MVSETKQMEISFTSNLEEDGQSVGKKNEVIAFFGDSIMERQDVKISPASVDTTIPGLVGKALNAEVHNFALGGTILTRPTDDQIDHLENVNRRNTLRQDRAISMMNLADAIAQKKPNDDSVWGSIKALQPEATAKIAAFDFSKVDTFCIAFGTNDWSWMKEAGGCYPLTSSSGEVSFESAAEFVVDRLKGAYPNANIVLFSPIWRGANKTGNTWDSTVFVPVAKGCRMTNLVTTLEDVAMRKQVYFCDNYHLIDFSTIDTYYGWLDNADSGPDYVHPNENGRRLIADHVSAYLKQIFGVSSAVTEYFTFHIKGKFGTTELYDRDYQVVKGQLVGSVFTNEVTASLSTYTVDGKTYKNPKYENIWEQPLTLAELQGQRCSDDTAIWYIVYQQEEVALTEFTFRMQGRYAQKELYMMTHRQV
ncbi:MAG: SGNH/GDSL hydrolase family protein [Clostridia bacterium]|nr:SGNH/GDSL hydrolase family protein [Clostridia bacterium]